MNASVDINTDQVYGTCKTLRDRFTKATLNDVDQATEHKISGKHVFIDSETIEVNGKQYQSKLYSGGWFHS